MLIRFPQFSNGLRPILLTLAGIVILASEEQSEKAAFPIEVKPSQSSSDKFTYLPELRIELLISLVDVAPEILTVYGILIEFDGKLRSTTPIELPVPGKFISFNELHSLNAFAPTVVTPSGIVILSSAVQPEKAPLSIVVTLSGSSILVILSHPANTSLPISVNSSQSAKEIVTYLPEFLIASVIADISEASSISEIVRT